MIVESADVIERFQLASMDYTAQSCPTKMQDLGSQGGEHVHCL
jgi:hypothetical protein